MVSWIVSALTPHQNELVKISSHNNYSSGKDTSSRNIITMLATVVYRSAGCSMGVKFTCSDINILCLVMCIMIDLFCS